MSKISVVIITLNEERNIERCLNSVKDIADEIIVVDSFSTDGTEDICKSFGVKFFQNKFEGYTEQKQFAAKLAKNDYILSLDADEALSEELLHSIQNVNWKYDAYSFNRLNYYCGKWIHHSSWYPDKKIRLYNKTKGDWNGAKVHELVKLHDGSTCSHLKGDLLHYTYYTIEEHVQQINKYSSIGATALFEKKKKTSSFKIFFNPTWRFIRNYFIKLGFLDGWYGFILCFNISYEVFLKYVKLKHLHNKKSLEKNS